MKEFEAFLAKAIEQKSDFGSVNFLPIISSVHNQPESWIWTLDFFAYILHLLICMSRDYPAHFIMPVKHLEHTLLQRPFGFPHGNCFVLQDLAVPNTPQTCSESLSAACGSFRCL